MGRPGLDNGWIHFHGVEIPPEQMLMKYSKIDTEKGKLLIYTIHIVQIY